MQGFVNVYKPSGVSSAYVVGCIKKKFHLSKVGHMGTLDPLAEGVLPIAIGKATRMFDYMLSKTKTYVVGMTFGYATDTLDSTGEVTNTSKTLPSVQQLRAVLSNFVGNIEQMPPKYSAKNVGGTRAYKLARAGMEVELKPSHIAIYSIELVSFEGHKCVLKVECGGGTYIRSLVRDIALALGTCATMTYLQRSASGYFTVTTSHTLDEINKLTDVLVPITQVFTAIPVVDVDMNSETYLVSGRQCKLDVCDGQYFVQGTQLLGVAKVTNGYAKLITYLKED